MFPGHHTVPYRCFRHKSSQFFLFTKATQQNPAVPGIPFLFQMHQAHLHAAFFHQAAQQTKPVQFPHHLRRHLNPAVRHLQRLGRTTHNKYGIFQFSIAGARFFFRSDSFT